MTTNFEQMGWKMLHTVTKRRYGTSINQHLKIIEKAEKKVTKIRSDIVFLKRCKKNQIIPKGLKIKNQFLNFSKTPRLFQELEFKLLKLLITENYKKLNKLEQVLEKSYRTLHSTNDTNLIYLTNVNVNQDNDKIYYISKQRHIQKFEKLLERKEELLKQKPTKPNSYKPPNIIPEINSVKNLSNRIFTEEEMIILNYGLNFALPTKQHKKLSIEAGINLECCLNRFPTDDEMKDKVRIESSIIIEKNSKHPDKNVQNYQWMIPIIKSMKSDDTITILPADKGNVTVVLNSQDYRDKIKKHLEDPIYQEINLNVTRLTDFHEVCTSYAGELHETLQNKLKSLLKMNRIDKSLHYKLNISNPKIPEFYGLPKIHKDGVPIRPICDYRGSSTYFLGFELNKILKPITLNSPYTLKNSYDFAQAIKDYQIPVGYSMASFDVVSLFTKVPMADTINYISEVLNRNDDWKERTSMTSKDIVDLLKICTNNNYFKWKEKLYKLTDGTPMGSPISPVLAEFIMQKLEVNKVEGNPNILFYRRYVDDCFLIYKSEFKQRILDDFNSFHNNIQFTIETEENGSLPFLDVLLERNESNVLRRRVFRKKTYSGRFLNYDSYHHHSHKLSVVDALLYRGMFISDPEFLDDEINHIKNILILNNYPSSLIDNRIPRMKNRVEEKLNTDPQAPLQNDNKFERRVILPYMGSLTGKLTKCLRRNLNCEFGFIPGNKISNLICNHKSKPAKSNIGVYKIPCSCGKLYIGESGRMELRMKEHERDLRLKRINKSALATHIMENPTHTISTESATLIESERRCFHRKFKEGLYIKKAKDQTINRDNGMDIHCTWIKTLLPLIETP